MAYRIGAKNASELSCSECGRGWDISKPFAIDSDSGVFMYSDNCLCTSVDSYKIGLCGWQKADEESGCWEIGYNEIKNENCDEDMLVMWFNDNNNNNNYIVLRDASQFSKKNVDECKQLLFTRDLSKYHFLANSAQSFDTSNYTDSGEPYIAKKYLNGRPLQPCTSRKYVENGNYNGHKLKYLVSASSVSNGGIEISGVNSGITSFVELYIPHEGIIPTDEGNEYKKITKIGNNAFRENPDLSAVTFTAIEVIGKAAFSGCTKLKEINWFSCSSNTDTTRVSTIKEIQQNAFRNCTSLPELDIPNRVTTIGDYAFADCTSASSLTIPSGVTTIGTSAFQNCSGLTSITIPDSVTTIGTSAFYDCSSLTSITVEATSPPTLGDSAFDYTNDCPIYVHAELVQDYKTTDGWSAYEARINPIQN